MSGRLKDKVAVVIGAGSTPGDTMGNGRATSILFAREGASVALVDYRGESAEETKKAIDEEGGKSFVVEADVTRAEDCKRLADACAEKYGKMKAVFNGGITAVCAALLAMYLFGNSWLLVGVILALFFTGFNLLESTLPSLVSKISPADAKGTAMGVYSTSQFMGGFFGGVMGGWVHQAFGYQGVFLAALFVGVTWLLVALTMSPPGHYSSRVLDLDGLKSEQSTSLARQLGELTGIVEAVVIAEEQVAYLKIDRRKLDESKLDALLAANELR